MDLIIGNGEVGKSLYNVLKRFHQVCIQDKEIKYDWVCEVLHICFPYDSEFVNSVKAYTVIYRPKYVVIHSTVPLGVSDKCGAYHSPIRGQHPNMEKGIKTFVKYLAPKSLYLKKYFEKCGIKVRLVGSTTTTEALKLWDTTQYADFIRLEKIIYKFCEENNVDFKVVYQEANKTYNEGYSKLGLKNVIRPILTHYLGKIGGHCLIPNCQILNDKLAKNIINFNKKL